MEGKKATFLKRHQSGTKSWDLLEAKYAFVPPLTSVRTKIRQYLQERPIYTCGKSVALA